MARNRYTPRAVAAAILKASATVKPDLLAERVANFLRAERAASSWPSIAHALRHPDPSNVVTISTAQPLADAALAKLEQTWGNVEARVRPELLGGAIVRAGDRQVDASLAGRLAKLERAMRSAN